MGCTHLQHVERAELHPAAFLGTIDLRAFDDGSVRRQVDAPRERRRRDEHLDVPRGEQVLDERTVDTCHAGVVDAEAVRQQVLQLQVLANTKTQSCDYTLASPSAQDLTKQEFANMFSYVYVLYATQMMSYARTQSNISNTGYATSSFLGGCMHLT